MTMQDNDDYNAAHLLGNGVIARLAQLDDTAVARKLTARIWTDILDDAADTPTDTPDIAMTPVHDLDRSAVIDRLIDDGVFSPPDGHIYDVDHEVAAEAYRLGRYDALAARNTTDD